jgi:hypothetical protein
LGANTYLNAGQAMSELKCFTIEGDPAQIGRGLGALAKPVFDAYMAQSSAWARVSPWRDNPFVAALRREAAQRFPDHVAELDGMAEALGWPAEDIFLWNCRGELAHRVPDGCTTLAAESPAGGVIAHNEDGDPYLKGECMLVEVRPNGKPGFVSFYYPGSLPGHTFAASYAGLAQAINNIRIVRTLPGVPRMILARAILDAYTLDEAVGILRDNPRASGFHHTIACADDARVLSIEATPKRCSIVRANEMRHDDTRIAGHANHLIHAGHEAEHQVVTDSSRDRQARLDVLLSTLSDVTDDESLLRVLRDRAEAGLPIYRDDPNDPDDENTLATGILRTEPGGVRLRVHCAESVFERFLPRAAPRRPL